MACGGPVPDFSGLRQPDLVRRRPGMYIGDTGTSGLTFLLLGSIEWMLDQMPWPERGVIEVDLPPEGAICVRDNGIPLSTGDALVRMVTGSDRPGTWSDWMVQVLCSLTSRLDIEIHTGGVQWRRSFSRGRAVGDVIRVGTSTHAGNSLTFCPDPDIFTETLTVPADGVHRRLVELAALQPGLRFSFNGETIHSPEGLDALYGLRIAGLTPVHPTPIRGRIGTEDGSAALVMGWNINGEGVTGYANGRFVRGGTHERGFRTALTRELLALLPGLAELRDAGRSAGEAVRDGLVAVLAVDVDEPLYLGATRERLGNPEAERLMGALTRQCVRAFVEERPDEAEAVSRHLLDCGDLFRRCLSIRRAEREARKREAKEGGEIDRRTP